MPPRPGTNKPLTKAPKVRYFKGKAPDAAPSDSDSDNEDEVKPQQLELKKVDDRIVAGGAGRVIQQGDESLPKMKLKLGDVKVEGGKVLIGGKVPQVKKGE